MLTTAALEAVRQGHEGAVQGQQLLAHRQAVLNRLTEAQEEVPQVDGSDELRLEPDHHQGNSGDADQGGSRDDREPLMASDDAAAGNAEGHLDFLA